MWCVDLTKNNLYLQESTRKKRRLLSILCRTRPISEVDKIIFYVPSIEQQPRKGGRTCYHCRHGKSANSLQSLIGSRHNNINQSSQAQTWKERDCHRPRKRHQTRKEAKNNDPRPARALVGIGQAKKRQCRAGSRGHSKVETTGINNQQRRRGHNDCGQYRKQPIAALLCNVVNSNYRSQARK